MEGEDVIYDDAIILNQSWEELEKLRWNPLRLKHNKYSKEARDKAYKSIKQLKS